MLRKGYFTSLTGGKVKNETKQALRDWLFARKKLKFVAAEFNACPEENQELMRELRDACGQQMYKYAKAEILLRQIEDEGAPWEFKLWRDAVSPLCACFIQAPTEGPHAECTKKWANEKTARCRLFKFAASLF